MYHPSAAGACPGLLPIGRHSFFDEPGRQQATGPPPPLPLGREGSVLTKPDRSNGLPCRMPEEGLEPTLPCGKWILNPSRLPFRHSGVTPPFGVVRQSEVRPSERPSEKTAPGVNPVPPMGATGLEPVTSAM